jgi:hypothetical protein
VIVLTLIDKTKKVCSEAAAVGCELCVTNPGNTIPTVEGGKKGVSRWGTVLRRDTMASCYSGRGP